MWIQIVISAFRALVIPILEKWAATTPSKLDDQAIAILKQILGDQAFIAKAKAEHP